MKKQTLLAAMILSSASFAADAPPAGEHRPKSPEERFKKLDADNNQSVTLEEFSSSKRAKEMDPEKVKQGFDRLDKDKDGKISLEEMKASGRPPQHPPASNNLDTDKDGKVSLDEFKASPRAKDAPADKVEEHFKHRDKDGSGFLEGEELRPPKHKGHRPPRPEGPPNGDAPPPPPPPAEGGN